MSKNKTNKKKHKHKQKKTYFQQWIGHSVRPAIAGICDNCGLFEYGTACNPKGLWCDKRGYLENDFVQACKECPDFKKKWQSVKGAGMIKSSFAQGADNYDDYFGGLY